MVLRELITKFGFETDDAGLKQLESGINDVKNSITKLAALGAAAAGALFGIAKETANTGDEAAKTARSIGLAVEKYQELSFAASIGGVEQAQFAGAMTKLARSAKEAQDGMATYKDTYDELGITVTDSNGQLKNTDVLLNEVADAFQKMPDGARKTALAQDLMGRSGAKMISSLNGGAEGLRRLSEEARASGFVLSEAETILAEEFNDSLNRTQSVLRGLRQTIGVALMPEIKEMVDTFRQWVLANADLIKQKLIFFMNRLKEVVAFTVGFMVRLWKATDTVIRLFGGWERVIKFVTFAMLGMLGIGFLIGIGKMAMGIVHLIRAFDLLKLKILLTNLAALAIPLLWGAAIAAVALIIEDLIAFFNGDDSVTGQIIDGFDDALNFVMDKFNQASTYIKEMMNSAIESMESKFESFGSVAKGIIVALLTPIRATVVAARTLGGVLGALTSGDFSGALDAIKQGGKDFFNPSVNTDNTSIQGALGFGERKPARMRPVNNEIKPTINIKNENGLTTEQTERATQRGIKEALGGVLRESTRQFETPVVE